MRTRVALEQGGVSKHLDWNGEGANLVSMPQPSKTPSMFPFSAPIFAMAWVELLPRTAMATETLDVTRTPAAEASGSLTCFRAATIGRVCVGVAVHDLDRAVEMLAGNVADGVDECLAVPVRAVLEDFPGLTRVAVTFA